MRNIKEEDSLIDEVMNEVRQMVKESMNGNGERIDSFVKNVIKPIMNHEYRYSLYFRRENEDRKLMYSFDQYIDQFYSGHSERGQKQYYKIREKFLEAFHRTVSETIVQG